MTKNNKKGFTIIEVVLVLAIAGLIFLMVFIALPALQRSQRNTQREDDIARFLTAVNDFQTNNSGKTPWQANKLGLFTKRYIDDTCEFTTDDALKPNSCGAQFTDPDGTYYEWNAAATAIGGQVDQSYVTGSTVDHKIYVVQAAGCGSTEGTYTYYAGERNIAMFYIEEGGAIICNDNH
ncbi:MAG: type II secretion system protein [Candidatus Saccharibacteria bacterium]|nr:type II secretion system protein [Candidatus Saccharibacteria bacterium]